MCTSKHLALAMASTMLVTGMAWATRFDDYTKRFANNADQAKVVSAGYLGGPGTEWLCGGGFQQDGTIVVAGTALGPTLSLAGTGAINLGGTLDTAILAPATRAKDDRGRDLPMSWAHPNATAFVALLSPDAKTVKDVVRFPWQAASATAAVVDGDDAIYLAGVATDALAALTADAKELPVDLKTIGDAKLTSRKVYLAKLSPDATKLVWLRTMTGPSNAPSLALNKAGKLVFQGPDMRVFDTNGATISVNTIPGGLGSKNAINPVDGTFAYGNEHHWPTGREPWRCPVLNIYQPDGKLLYHLYDWGGPFVGLGEQRLVSDTAVRYTTYNEDGDLILYMWSDGGNSVAVREPIDVYKGASAMKGLGMSAWGAGVLSMAYIVKIDTTTYRVKGGTVWAAFLPGGRDKPNSIWIDTLGFGPDGTTVAGGRSATGLIQTGNNINPTKPGANPGDPRVPGDPSGTYVTVFSKDLDSLRFSSAMPNCADSDLHNGDRWAFVGGTVKGKPMLLVLSGAVAKDGNGNQAPTVNAAQANYGGGLDDGHMLVLDLSEPAPQPAAAN